jgi:hypothetical protein
VEREERAYGQGVAEPLIGMRLWLARSPWRLGPAWAACAGTLAASGILSPRWDWGRAILLLFLVDPAWGSLWAVLAERRRDTSEVASPVTAPVLPYLRPGSPAARLLGWAESDLSLAAAWRLGLPSFVVASLAALALGREAVIAAALAYVLCLVGWVTRRLQGQPSAWAQSFLMMGAPWGLGYALFATMGWLAWAWAAAWTVWQRGAIGIARREAHAWWMLGVAQVAVLGILLFARRPLGAAMVAVACAPTWWTRSSSASSGEGEAGAGSSASTPAPVWWWLAFLLSNAALGGFLG